jgi:hypothetical protein
MMLCDCLSVCLACLFVNNVVKPPFLLHYFFQSYPISSSLKFSFMVKGLFVGLGGALHL